LKTGGSPGSKGDASQVARRPFSALSILYGGFVFLVLVSQLSGRLLMTALTAYGAGGGSEGAGVQRESTDLAYSAAVLGLVFSAAVIFTVRNRLDPELRVYRATGLPLRSVLRLILSSHPVIPVSSALVIGTLAGLTDLLIGLNPAVPAGLALAFVGILLGWLVFHTVTRFSRQDADRGRSGRVG
jgi:hypothetical protein